MTTVNVYLAFKGNCMEAFDFYKSVLGGEFIHATKFSDMPPQEGMPPLADNELDKIMHIGLPISKETILMGSDTPESFRQNIINGNNFSISINTDTIEEADRIFGELSVGGKVMMPMDKTFWGAYFGMFTDKFDINWMINVELEQENK